MWKVALFRAWLLALLLSATGGCSTTQLTATKVGSDAGAGHVYFLPRVEHLVALDRELTKCESGVTKKRVVEEWLAAEIANLSKLKEKLKESGLASQHPACGSEVVEGMKTQFGEAYETVKRLLPEKAPADCSNGDGPEFELAYQQVLNGLLVEFLSDSIFSEKIDWGTQDKCRPEIFVGSTVSSFRAATDRLAALTVCAESFDKKVDARFEVEMRASVTPHILPDMEHVYSIQYAAMTKGLKKTNYSVEKYPNGTLKGINVTIEDRTAEVIQSSVRGGLKILAMLNGVPPVATPHGAGDVRTPSRFANWSTNLPQHLQELCTPAVMLLLKNKSNLESAANEAAAKILAFMKVAEAKLAEAEKAKTQATERQAEHDALPADSPKKVALKTEIEALKETEKAARAAAKKAEEEKKEIEEEQGGSIKAFAEIRKKLTFTHSYLYRAAGADEEIPGAGEAATSWLRNPAAACTVLACGSPNTPAVLKANVASYLPPRTAAVPTSTSVGEDAIVYREPVKGLLVVCQEQKCLDSNGGLAVTPANSVLVSTADFPQRGILATLPLENKSFQNNTLVASFSETGSLQKLTYESNARAEKAAAVFESTADEVLKFTEAKRGAKKRDIETKTEEIKAETERIKAQKALEDALKALKDGDSGATEEAGNGEASPEG